MNKIDFLQLKKHLAEHPCVNLAIAGNDAYLADKALEQIKASLNLEFEELNCTVLSDVADAGKIADACLPVPFMSARRMVVVKNYAPKSENEKIKLRDYLFKPNEQTCLVICFADKRIAAEFDIGCVECDKLEADVLAKWITARVSKSGRGISAQAAALLAEYCLNDMGRISSETEKLCAYAEKEITEETVQLLVEKESDFVVWELGQEIAKKNADGAMAAAIGLLDKGEDVVSLTASIYALFRRMFYVSVSGMAMKDLAASLDVKEFAVKKAREAAENFTQVQLKNALELCRRAEEEVKTFNSDKLNVFYGLILGLLNL